MSTIEVHVSSPRQAHAAMNALFQQHVKPVTSYGTAGVLTWETHSERLRRRSRGLLHAGLLRTISESARLTDPDTGLKRRYSVECWKVFFKQQFLTPRPSRRVATDTGEVTTLEMLPSTEDLSDDEYSEFCDEIRAFAVLDLGIELPEE